MFCNTLGCCVGASVHDARFISLTAGSPVFSLWQPKYDLVLVKLIVGSQRNVAWRKSKYIFKDVSLPIVAPLRAIFGQISTFEFTVLSHFFL